MQPSNWKSPKAFESDSSPDYKARLEDAHFPEMEEESHLWAVSYADFLMVLLSFFVIFFSIDQESQEEIKDKIIELTKAEKTLLTVEGDLVKSVARFPGKSLYEDKTRQNRMISSIGGTITAGIDGVKVLERLDEKALTIALPDNIFALNAVNMTRKGEKALELVLEALVPHKGNVEITIVGHSDNSKVIPRSRKLIANNFALSSLRASGAIVKAIKKGFPEASLSIKGDANYKRHTRSLSLLVTAKEAINE